jgi:hypothetical protein
MISAGLGISAMFNLLHSFEIDVNKKPKRNSGMDDRLERKEDLGRRIRPNR